jgi:PBP1b-binding outer membrane lipoprotein LpoB
MTCCIHGSGSEAQPRDAVKRTTKNPADDWSDTDIPSERDEPVQSWAQSQHFKQAQSGAAEKATNQAQVQDACVAILS